MALSLQLEAEVNRLETAFKSAEERMANIEERIDAQIQESAAVGEVSGPSCSTLISSIHQLRQEHKNIVSEMDELKAAHESVMAQILGMLQETISAVDCMKRDLGPVSIEQKDKPSHQQSSKE